MQEPTGAPSPFAFSLVAWLKQSNQESIVTHLPVLGSQRLHQFKTQYEWRIPDAPPY